MPPPDPKPVPPLPPEPGDCCGQGCAPCIHDTHAEAMDAYRASLQAWQARHPDEAPAGDNRDAG